MGTNFSEILIKIHAFSFKKMHLEMSSGKWRPFCLGFNVLTHWGRDKMAAISQTTTFKYIFLNENVIISAKISLKFVPTGPIDNIPAFIQIMAWCRPGDKSLSEPMMVRLPTRKSITRPQWVNTMRMRQNGCLIQISLKFVLKCPINNKQHVVCSVPSHCLSQF